MRGFAHWRQVSDVKSICKTIDVVYIRVTVCSCNFPHIIQLFEL